ncbi:MAG: hypothetical protein COB56_08045 [Robiginitomaculum sp.]|nr:MAG: hypothetical protein COB56_08045 [Robiginitomaculum sp.]
MDADLRRDERNGGQPTPNKKLIHGSSGCPYPATMKLDLIEINKLSPPRLWGLGVLVAVIAMLRGARHYRRSSHSLGSKPTKTN